MANPKKDEIQYNFHEIADKTFRVGTVPRHQPSTKLPAGVYILSYHETQTEAYFYLKPALDFELPKRVYGNVLKNIDRFFKSYCINNKNLGALLVGERGSGKTITLKAMAKAAIDLDMPVILINQPYAGDLFVSFLASITQDCMLAFDEFCKTYSEQNKHGQQYGSKAQDSILQVLDGVSASGKKLTVLTANDMHLISKYLQDRPSRVRYIIRFKHMDVNTVEEYVREHLKDKDESHVGAFVHLALSHANDKVGMNFDGMASFVEEMNQFDNDLNECIEIMATNGRNTNSYFEMKAYQDCKEVHTGTAVGSFQGVYLNKDKFSIDVSYYEFKEDKKSAENVTIKLSQDDFVGYFADDKTKLEFKKGDVSYICRYIDRDAYHAKFREAQEEFERVRMPWRNGRGYGGHYGDPALQQAY